MKLIKKNRQCFSMNSYSLNNDKGDGRQEASFQKLSQTIASNIQKIHQNGKKKKNKFAIIKYCRLMQI